MPVFLAGMTISGCSVRARICLSHWGRPKVSIFIALLRKVILLIPLALMLPYLMGVMGVYAAEAISDAAAAICCTVIFAVQFPRIMNKLTVRS